MKSIIAAFLTITLFSAFPFVVLAQESSDAKDGTVNQAHGNETTAAVGTADGRSPTPGEPLANKTVDAAAASTAPTDSTADLKSGLPTDSTLGAPENQGNSKASDSNKSTDEVVDMAVPVMSPQENGSAVINDVAVPIQNSADGKSSAEEVVDLAVPLISPAEGKSMTVTSAPTDGTVEQPAIQLRKKNEDAKLTLQYPSQYPYPLVGIQFPVDFSASLNVDIAALKQFRKYSASTREQLISEQVVRSTYTACALYHHLTKLLPEHSVILIPTKLQFDSKSNRVISFPVNKAVPPLVLVDLYADVSLARVERPSAHLSDSDTFGDHARTFVSMSMPINGKRRTFAGVPVIDPDTKAVGENIETFYNLHCAGKNLKSVNKVDDAVVASKPQYVQGSFVSLDTDFRYPYKELLGAPMHKQIRYYSNIILDALNTQKLETVAPALLAEYVDDIDIELFESLSNPDGKPPAMFEKKVRYFHHFLPQQRQQLFSKDSKSVADVVLLGDLGKQYLSSLKGEADFARQTAASKRKAAFGSVLSIASTAGAVACAFTPVPSSIGTMCTTMAITAAGVVATQLKLQKELSVAFNKTTEASRDTEIKCVLLIDNDKIEVSGKDNEAFRKKLFNEYQRKFGTTAKTTQGVL